MDTTQESTFNAQEFEYAYPDGIEHHYWSIARNSIIRNVLVNAGLADQAILEVGCGKGIVVSFLRKYHLPCWGAEVADIAPVHDAVPFVFFNTDATTLDKKLRSEVRTLMFLDVLEHIRNPKAFLDELLHFYPNVRNLLITVPARQELWSNYDEFYRHFQRYDLSSARQLAENAGFAVKKTGYFFHILYLVSRVLFLFTSRRNVKIRAPKGASKIVHRLFGWILMLDNALLPEAWYGTSVICLASRDK